MSNSIEANEIHAELVAVMDKISQEVCDLQLSYLSRVKTASEDAQVRAKGIAEFLAGVVAITHALSALAGTVVTTTVLAADEAYGKELSAEVLKRCTDSFLHGYIDSVITDAVQRGYQETATEALAELGINTCIINKKEGDNASA